MKRRIFLSRLLLAGALLSPWGHSSFAADTAPEQKTVRVFSLGNSFSGNARRYLTKLGDAAGVQIITKAVEPGGCPMSRHWAAAKAGEETPDDPKAKELYKGKTLKEAMGDIKYDYVTIQQYSFISNDINSYRPYAAELKALLAKYQPQAELLIHETWAYQVDDPLFHNPQKPYTQAQMQADVAKNYRTIAEEIGVKRLLPSGLAFKLVETDPAWGYKPDADFEAKVKAKTVEEGALPDQSHAIHVGYSWATKGEKKELRYDGHHANVNGCYLAGCVWLETLTGVSPVGNTYVPEGMNAETAAFLQQKAHEAVLAEKKREK